MFQFACYIRRLSDRIVRSSLIATRFIFAVIQILCAIILILIAIMLIFAIILLMFAMLLPNMRKKNVPAEAEGGADGNIGVDSSAGFEVGTQDDAGFDLGEQIDRETYVVKELGGILSKAGALVITLLRQLLPSKKRNPSSAA